MTAMDVHLPVAEQSSIGTYVEQALAAEEAGYEFVWMPETWGRNAVPILTRIADETERIGIGSSILNVYSRSPTLLGQTGATLQEVSDGRARLGLGPSGPIVIEGWHGEAFGNPLKRLREAVEIAKLVQTGETVNYDGDVFSLAGFRLRSDPPDPPAPVDATGMGPKAVELAGRFADGWHGIVLTPDGVRERLSDFERGGDLGDRSRTEQRTSHSITVCALPDGERARRLTRQHLAFYVGAMGEYYREALSRQGFEETATEVAAKWGSGEREAAMDAISDELLDQFAAAGTPSEVRDLLKQFSAIDGLDALAIGFPRAATHEAVLQSIEAVAPLAG
ncbi:MAG: TIGR04024 family LLM class F420-dependent oxidoreductase [Halodesulfurarchaeum sp.]